MFGNDGAYCYPQMEVDEEEEEELYFSGVDLLKIRDAVFLLVQTLLRLLQTFPVKDRPQCASNCTQVTTGPPLLSLHTTLERWPVFMGGRGSIFIQECGLSVWEQDLIDYVFRFVMVSFKTLVFRFQIFFGV